MSAALPAYGLIAVIGVGLASIDVRRRRLPHVLTGTVMATCLISFIVATAASGNPAPTPASSHRRGDHHDDTVDHGPIAAATPAVGGR